MAECSGDSVPAALSSPGCRESELKCLACKLCGMRENAKPRARMRAVGLACASSKGGRVLDDMACCNRALLLLRRW